MAPLGRAFYSRRTEVVARELLGKTLVRRLGGEALGGRIVETEAYFGSGDPASRAHRGLKRYNRAMFGEPGRLFIYNVHRYWMLNIVAHRDGVGAVLVRALEPTLGVEAMRRNRPTGRLRDLTRGPGRLSQALAVDKSLDGVDVTRGESPVVVLDSPPMGPVARSPRVGVTRDLPEPYRFYVAGNPWVSG